MKKQKRSFCRLLVLGVLVALLTVACMSLALADEVTPEAAADSVLTYDGLSARMRDYGGIRSVYLVDREAVASLEGAGYKVAYGAVMAIADYDGEVLNTTRGLAVAGDHTSGYDTVNDYAAAVVVYATDSPAYATGIYLDETQSSFAFTTTYSDAVSAKYATELVYTGFVAVTDSEGVQTVVYDYAEGSLFGAEGAVYGAGTSVLDVSDWFVNNYSKDAVKAYAYNQNGTLKRVLTTCGREVRTLTTPVSVTPINGEVALSKTVVDRYLADALAAYRTDAYADYKTSVVGNYSTTAANLNDTPLPVTLSWSLNGNGAPAYTVALATDAAFTQNVRTYETVGSSLSVYNLLAGTTYYYKVTAVTADGYRCVSDVLTFKTADTVRWINVDGVRNVRDIGGWNGLNQGLVYRGSELNQTQSYGTAITEAGILAMRNDLGIKTHLDFRPAESNTALFGTSSPLGEGVAWENHPISAFLPALNSGNKYTTAMKLFADYDNYPIYMNCVGGADRTGTAVFMVEGLCGVDEADLAIDLELTSFSKFGYRYRYDNSTYIYATLVERVKEYSGNTLQEKFESVFREVYGFSEAEISNVQAILTQNGAVYDFGSGENGDVLPADFADGKFVFTFTMRDSTAVRSVTVGGISLDFSFDPSTSTLTVYTEKLENSDVLSDVGTILFDDGAHLRFFVETPNAERIVAEIVGGDYGKIFAGADAVTDNFDVTVSHDGNFEITGSMVEALYHAGYESLSVTLPAGVTVKLYNDAEELLSTVTYAEETEVKLLLDGGKIVFSADAEAVVLKALWLNPYGASWADEIMAGDYNAFFGAGTNGMSGDGMALLNVTKPNFVVSAATVKKLVDLGYTHLTFTLDADFAEGTQGCYVVVIHGEKRYERLYSGLTATDGRVKATVTVALDEAQSLQIITRTCALNADGTVNMSNRVEALPETFVISGVLFARSGTEGVVDLKDTILPDPDPTPDPDPEPEPEPDPEPDPEPTVADRIVDGELGLLISTGSAYYTVTDGAVVTGEQSMSFKFSNEALEALREAGYTKITFTMSAEAQSLGRIVCRWQYTGAWQSAVNKNDLNPATSGQEKTVTFDLTQTTSGAGWYIAFEIQDTSNYITTGILTLNDFLFE